MPITINTDLNTIDPGKAPKTMDQVRKHVGPSVKDARPKIDMTPKTGDRLAMLERLEGLQTTTELINWYGDLYSQTPSPGVRDRIRREMTSIGKWPPGTKLDTPYKTGIDLLVISRNLLNQAYGFNNDRFTPTWSDTLYNALKATSDAVVTVAEEARDAGKSTWSGVKSSVGFLPVFVGVGVVAAAWAFGGAKGKK